MHNNRTVSRRTLDLYARHGVIEKPKKMFIGDQRVYWDRKYIINELKAIKYLQAADITLNEISKLVEDLDRRTHKNLYEFICDSINSEILDEFSANMETVRKGVTIWLRKT